MDSRTKSSVLSKFLHGVNDREWWIRNNSVAVLRGFPAASSVVVPIVSQALLDPNPWTQLAAAGVLHAVAPDRVANSGAVRILVKVCANPAPQIAAQAAETLGQLGAEPEIAVPALMATLKSNALIADTAVEALARFRSWPVGSRATVKKLLGDPDADVRQRARNVLAAPAAAK